MRHLCPISVGDQAFHPVEHAEIRARPFIGALLSTDTRHTVGDNSAMLLFDFWSKRTGSSFQFRHRRDRLLSGGRQNHLKDVNRDRPGQRVALVRNKKPDIDGQLVV
jgi:hypothetical protein